jgi:hypothetical protein
VLKDVDLLAHMWGRVSANSPAGFVVAEGMLPGLLKPSAVEFLEQKWPFKARNQENQLDSRAYARAALSGRTGFIIECR